MRQKIINFLLGLNSSNSLKLNLGFLILRFFVGLALCTVFEKLFPRNGIWGPQEWFIQDVSDMGFPFPELFAWLAILIEFFGGIFLMLGLLTRPAAILVAIVTASATFLYHQGDIVQSGLVSFTFLIMSICIALFGAGKYSLDYFINRSYSKIDS